MIFFSTADQNLNYLFTFFNLFFAEFANSSKILKIITRKILKKSKIIIIKLRKLFLAGTEKIQ